MSDIINSRFLRSLKNYLRYWQSETAVLDNARINKLDPEFANLLTLLQTAVLVPQVIIQATELLLQCFFWVEAKGHIFLWREVAEAIALKVPPEQINLRYRILKQLAQLYRLEGKQEASLTTLALAYSLAKQQNDSLLVAEILINQAQVYWEQKKFSPAQETITQAFDLLGGKQNRLVGIAHQMAAEVARGMGQLETAVSHLHQAKTCFQDSPHITDTTRTLNSLAVTYQQMRAYDAALQLFPQITGLLANTVYERDMLEAKLNWGHLLYELSHFTQAQAIFADVIYQLRNQDSYIPFQAIAHNSLACTLRELGSFSQAEAHFIHSRSLYQRLDDPYLLANTLGGLAALYEHQGLLEKTAVLLAEALKLLETASNNPWAVKLKKEYQTWQQKMENKSPTFAFVLQDHR